MPFNYSLDGTSSTLFHYKTRLISSYFNKLFFNIFQPGIIPETGQPTIVDANGDPTTSGIQIKIPSGFSFFISPNNRNAGGVIQDNFNVLSNLEKSILEKQILKCDIIKDFYVVPLASPNNWGYLVAEFNYLEFSDLTVEFKTVQTGTKPTDNQVVLGYLNKSGDYIISIDTDIQDICTLNENILYEMNVDKVDGYHAGNESGYAALSNGTMCSGLNTEMVNGYSGYQAAEKWQSNSGLNVEYISDEFSRYTQPNNIGNGSIPLSNKIMNVDLNAELLGGSGYSILEKTTHVHSLDNITDGPIYKKPLNVNTNHHLTNDSFKDGAFTKNKIADECFFARNDDLGGPLTIVTGQTTLSTNYSSVAFTPKHPTSQIFAYPPDVALQIIDLAFNYTTSDYVKLNAVDITNTHFTVEYTNYSAVDGAQWAAITNKELIIQWVAIGYAVDDSVAAKLSKPI